MAAVAPSPLGGRHTEGGGAAHLELYFKDPRALLVTRNAVAAEILPTATSHGLNASINDGIRRRLRSHYERLGVTKKQIHKLAKHIVESAVTRLKRRADIPSTTKFWGTKAWKSEVNSIGKRAAAVDPDAVFWAWLYKASLPGITNSPSYILGRKIVGNTTKSPPRKAAGRDDTGPRSILTPKVVNSKFGLGPKLGLALYLESNQVRRELRNYPVNKIKNWWSTETISENHRGRLRNTYNKLATTSTALHRLAGQVLDQRLRGQVVAARKNRLKMQQDRAAAIAEGRSPPTSFNSYINKNTLDHYGEVLFWAWLWNVTKRRGAVKNTPVKIAINRFEGPANWLMAVHSKWATNK